MVSEIRNYPNGVISTTYSRQTPSDKDEKIRQNNTRIRELQQRLETETNPAIRARCEEIINNLKSSNKDLEASKVIISRNPWHDLCVPKWKNQK